MTEFRARIGRIRMKNGGAEVRVLDRQAPNQDGENWCGKVVENARAVASFSTDEAPLVGYILVGFYSDGAFSAGFRYDHDRCAIPRSLVPAWVAEVLRRDLITEPVATKKFHDMFEWRDNA